MAGQAGTIATAYVQVLPSMKGIGSNLSKQMQGPSAEAGSKAGKSLGSAIKGAIAKIGITAAVAKTFKDAISEGAKLQQSYLGGLDTIYKESANSVRGYADAAASYGISANDYAEQAISFGAALRQAFGGDTQKAAESANMAIMDMADNAAKMGTDVGSLQYAYQGFAKQNYTMLDNLKLGYGGTKSEMERLLADAQKLTGVKYDISNLGDVYEAIHVIQGELGITGVAADEAKTTVSGSFEAMKASAKDLIGHMALGDDIKPQLVAFGGAIKTFLMNLIPMIGNILKIVGETAASAIVAGIKKLPGLMTQAAGFLSGLADKINGITGPQMDQAFSNIQDKAGAWISGTFVPFMTSQFIPALQKLGTAIFNVIGAFFTRIVPQLLSMAANGIKSLVNGLMSASSGDVNASVTNGLNAVASTVGSWITGTLGPYLKNSLLPALGQLGLAILELLGALGLKVLQVIGSLLSNIWNALTAKFPVLQTIADGIVTVVTTTIGVIKSIIMGIVSVIKTIVDFVATAWNTIKNVVQVGIMFIQSILNAAFQILTLPWRLIWENFGDEITDAWENIKSVVSAAMNAIKSVISVAWNAIKAVIVPILEAIKSVITSAFNAIKSVITSILNAIRSVFTNVWNGIKSFVSGVINGIKSIISGGMGAMQRAVSGPLNAIRNAFTSTFNGIKGFMSGVVGWLKGIFNFQWSLPRISLPHFSINGKFSLNPPSVPHLSVAWYAKGGILTSPTIFGMQGGSLLGGGEAGPEAVLPISTLKSYISDSLDEHERGNRTVYNIYIDGIKYNTDSYIDGKIDGFVKDIIRKGAMYSG